MLPAIRMERTRSRTMARPNNAASLSGHIRGLREAKAAFQAMPALMREDLNDATELTVREISRHAQARVQSSPSIRTRTLLNAIGWSLNRKSGRGRAGVSNVTTTISNPSLGTVGRATVKIKGAIVSHRGRTLLVRPSRYAHLVEFGARHMRAEPFMIPSTEGQKQPFLDRCRHAGKKLETQMAAKGRHL